MALKLVVEGENRKVHKFVEEIHKNKGYRFHDRSEYFISSMETRLEYYLDESQYLTEQKRDIAKVMLQIDENKIVEIVLLDSKVIDMNGTKLVIGKNFDIFA